jgi:hypothetical protein
VFEVIVVVGTRTVIGVVDREQVVAKSVFVFDYVIVAVIVVVIIIV